MTIFAVKGNEMKRWTYSPKPGFRKNYSKSNDRNNMLWQSQEKGIQIFCKILFYKPVEKSVTNWIPFNKPLGFRRKLNSC